MATYKHLRSSTANKRPTTSIADGQLAINTNTASPGLFFKDSAGTGIVKVGPVHVGTTAPNSVPASGGSTGNYKGEQWLDTSVSPAQMKVWNGSAWVGVVADELPVSKLQDGTVGQIVQTDAAGTGVEWSSTTNLPLGSAGAPAYRFQGDPNTGIYSPGADQVAISTAGTGRLFVDASGNVGINTNPATPLHVETASAETEIRLTTTGGDIRLRGFNDDLVVNADQHRFNNEDNSTEYARIDSAGRLLMGTSSSRQVGSPVAGVQLEGDDGDAGSLTLTRFSDSSFGNYLTIGKARGTRATPAISQDNDAIGSIQFASFDGIDLISRAAEITAFVDGTPGANDMPGRLVFSVTADGASSPTEAMRIKNSRILNFANTPVYADNAAAKTGGLVDGDVYRKSDGTLMIVYT